MRRERLAEAGELIQHEREIALADCHRRQSLLLPLNWSSSSANSTLKLVSEP